MIYAPYRRERTPIPWERDIWLREIQHLITHRQSVLPPDEPDAMNDGDEILVERLSGPPRDGVHVVRLNTALLVKRLDTSRPGRLALVSDNCAYPTIETDPGAVQVIGRAVWKSGRI